jgi:nonsense-mediated mRNA decay protein 3
MTRSCPKCGKDPTKDHPFVKGFCTQCYFEQYPLIVLRRPPEAKVCPRCNAYYTSGRWVHQGSVPDTDHVYNMVCDLLDPLFDPSEPATFEVELADPPTVPLSKAKHVDVTVTATIPTLHFQENQQLTVPITLVLCDQCKQTAGGYFEATIQVRTASGKLSPTQENEILEYITHRLDEQDLPKSAVKFTEKRVGFDIKCISGRFCRSLAKNLATHFGLQLKVSSKVAGRTRDGKPLTRETYALRFPPFEIQDVIAYMQQPFMITGLHNGRYTLTNLKSGQKQSLNPKELAEIDAQFLNDQIQSYQVISLEGDVYQLMSQIDYTIYDYPQSSKTLQIGSMVSAIEWEKHLVLLPNSDEE